MVDKKEDYRAELAANAKKIARPGCGILAADESTGTIGKKFAAQNIENSEENRRAYRELLFTTPGLEKYISGVILYDETTKQSTKDGVKFMDLLDKLGILPGIKVDKGVQPLPGAINDESWTSGLDNLAKECANYYKIGCRFAKWRAVLKIGNGSPSDLSILENAWGLARYAKICQANGLVPIVEPEILSDGTHSIEVCQAATEKVNHVVFKALADNNVQFEGMLLKPNMVTPGSQSGVVATPEEIATRTAIAFSRTVVPAVPGIMFLSGGQSEEQASYNLNAMNRLQGVSCPWAFSFSYGRALQNTCVKTWAGKSENLKAAQDALLLRAKSNSEAQLGQFKGSGDEKASESLYVADYKY